MVRLILVRHGQSESNVTASLDSAEPGAPLTELGRQQASALPARLEGEQIERVVASPLARAVATAQPLTASLALPLGQDIGLREVLTGDLQMRNDPDAHAAHLDLVTAWAGGDLEARHPGSAESGHEFLARYDRAIAAAVSGARGTVVVVSHGDAIRLWTGFRSENLATEKSLARGLSNTGTVVLEGEPGLWNVVDWHSDDSADVEEDPTGAPSPR